MQVAVVAGAARIRPDHAAIARGACGPPHPMNAK